VFFVARACVAGQSRALRVALGLVATLATTTIVLARSEGALIALAAGLVVLGILHARTRRWTIITATVLAAVLLLIPTTRTYFLDRAQLKSESGPVRLLQWRETVAMLRDRPILGAGFSGYPITVAPYHTAEGIEIYQYPHNIVLNFWTEMGVFGVVAFGWIMFALFHMAFARRDAIASMVIAILVVVLVHGIVDVPYFKNDLALFFWFLAALLVISREKGMMDNKQR
jgi:putative inorganic carbon (HCO3(-)) transporter